MATYVQESGAAYTNTWGDAIVSVSDDPLKLALAALNLRDLFLNEDWIGLEMPELLARIALHAGTIFVGDDPFTGREGIVGAQVNLAARVEPVTPPGHVWATDSFISLIAQHQQRSVKWDDLGEVPLAKAWGAKHLFRVRRSYESDHLPAVPTDEAVTTMPSEAERAHRDLVSLQSKRVDAHRWLLEAIASKKNRDRFIYSNGLSTIRRSRTRKGQGENYATDWACHACELSTSHSAARAQSTGRFCSNG